MSNKTADLHGSAPDKSDVALLLIDVINDFDFQEADQLLKYAIPMAKKIKSLKARAKAAGIPAIYVNDNFGRWRSDFQAIVQHCDATSCPGQAIVAQLKPDTDDYFVLKPKHSAFYSTTLDVLLTYLQAKSLIITGIASNICVLFTANDAYMRDYRLTVPADCVAANTEEANSHALHQISTLLKADITVSDQLDLISLARREVS